MRITIITSTLNCMSPLVAIAASIREQTYREVQRIVVDGESMNGTIEVIPQNADIIYHWLSESDTGVYDAWNKACPYIYGNWVLFLGAGDLLHARMRCGAVRRDWANCRVNQTAGTMHRARLLPTIGFQLPLATLAQAYRCYGHDSSKVCAQPEVCRFNTPSRVGGFRLWLHWQQLRSRGVTCQQGVLTPLPMQLWALAGTPQLHRQ